MFSILRLGHRIFRDQRITTHCALIARSLGAQKFFYTGEKDASLEESVRKIVQKWGGPFDIQHLESEKSLLKKFKGIIIHLTVYGIPFEKKMRKIKKSKSLLIIVGGEKVPPEIYQRANYNLAVSSQPHSEVAALGIFLYEMQGRKFKEKFKNSQVRVIPKERGKNVIKYPRKV